MLGKQVKVNDQRPLSIRCCARHWGGSGARGREEPAPRSGLQGESLRFYLSVAGTEMVRGVLPQPWVQGAVPGRGDFSTSVKGGAIGRKGTPWGSFPPVDSGNLCPVA